MKKKITKKQKHLNEIAELVKFVSENYAAKVTLISKRCALEGCRYGYELIDKEPADKCMYCGEPRNYYFDIDGPVKSIAKTLKKSRPKLL